MRAVLALVGVSMMAVTASAAPLHLRNGTSVRVAVHGQREPGVGLKMKSRGWRLELAERDADGIDAVDVTDGAHDARWSIEQRDGSIFFDDARFIAGHAYRLFVRSGMKLRGTALIYLFPPPMISARSRVSFDDDAPGHDSDELAISKKPGL